MQISIPEMQFEQLVDYVVHAQTNFSQACCRSYDPPEQMHASLASSPGLIFRDRLSVCYVNESGKFSQGTRLMPPQRLSIQDMVTQTFCPTQDRKSLLWFDGSMQTTLNLYSEFALDRKAQSGLQLIMHHAKLSLQAWSSSLPLYQCMPNKFNYLPRYNNEGYVV